MQPAPPPPSPPSAQVRNRQAHEQDAVLAAAGREAQHELGKPVRLAVVHLKVEGRWAFLHARMLDPQGLKFSYVGTPREEDARAGLMSDRYAALLSHGAAGWSVVVSAVGATGAPWEGWARFGAPADLLQP